jgi:hypothetical protein
MPLIIVLQLILMIIFCSSDDDCDINPQRPAYMVVWSRFGNVSKFKYSSGNEWIMQ